jgi:hypothetical protein
MAHHLSSFSSQKALLYVKTAFIYACLIRPKSSHPKDRSTRLSTMKACQYTFYTIKIIVSGHLQKLTLPALWYRTVLQEVGWFMHNPEITCNLCAIFFYENITISLATGLVHQFYQIGRFVRTR